MRNQKGSRADNQDHVVLRLVGWSISERMTADIVIGALENAKAHGYVAENAIFHSDKGA